MPQVAEEKIWKAFHHALVHLRDNPAVITEHIQNLERKYRAEHAEEIEGLESRLSSIEIQLADLDAGRNRMDVSHADRIKRQNELKIRQVEIRRKLNCFKDNRIGQSRELLSLIHSLGGSFVLNGTAGMGDCEEGADRNQWSSNDTDGCGAVEDGGNTADREK